MKVLGVGAHPDDIEIFMYGLLSIYKKAISDILKLYHSNLQKSLKVR